MIYTRRKYVINFINDVAVRIFSLLSLWESGLFLNSARRVLQTSHCTSRYIARAALHRSHIRMRCCIFSISLPLKKLLRSLKVLVKAYKLAPHRNTKYACSPPYRRVINYPFVSYAPRTGPECCTRSICIDVSRSLSCVPLYYTALILTKSVFNSIITALRWLQRLTG